MDRWLFEEIWLVDFEFSAGEGERPTPICCVARELWADHLERCWLADGAPALPPFSTGPKTLYVAYYASAELGCHLALDWSIPPRILDLFVEFRCLTNGLPVPCGNSLLGALAYFGLDAIDALEKETMRELAMRGGPYTAAEREALLDNCQTDVDALARLLPLMMAKIDLPRALLRGRYMAAAAHMEWNGVPIDTGALTRLRDDWERIKSRLIVAVDVSYGVFVRTGRRASAENDSATTWPMTFSAARFADYLQRQRIPWPQLPSGNLALDDDTFREMARAYPTKIGPIRELRYTLSQLRLNELSVGSDGRNRCLLSAFRARTSRNQPSNSHFIFGPSAWLRSLIRPSPGRAVAYCDWSQQELAIAAALSGDQAMQKAYTSGDFYLTFAKMAGAVPPDATKKTHADIRDQFKIVALGVLYGLTPAGLARKLAVPLCRGRELLWMHQETFRQFWRWSDQVEMQGMLTCEQRTVFGWTYHAGTDANPRAMRNYPMQANGAEMMRLACCLATERGITVCCPVHDALLIEADIDLIDEAVVETQRAMREASELVLPSFPLRTEAKIVRYPDRYMDERGRRMWETVTKLLDEEENRREPLASVRGVRTR